MFPPSRVYQQAWPALAEGSAPPWADLAAVPKDDALGQPENVIIFPFPSQLLVPKLHRGKYLSLGGEQFAWEQGVDATEGRDA